MNLFFGMSWIWVGHFCHYNSLIDERALFLHYSIGTSTAWNTFDRMICPHWNRSEFVATLCFHSVFHECFFSPNSHHFFAVGCWLFVGFFPTNLPVHPFERRIYRSPQCPGNIKVSCWQLTHGQQCWVQNETMANIQPSFYFYYPHRKTSWLLILSVRLFFFQFQFLQTWIHELRIWIGNH